MKIAMLYKPQLAYLDLSYTGGEERVYLNDLDLLRKNNIEYQAFISARMSPEILKRYKISRIIYPKFLNDFHLFNDVTVAFLRDFFELVYTIIFAVKTRDFDRFVSYQKNAFLSLLLPRKTVTLFHEFPRLPLAAFFKSRYKKGRYIFCSQFLKRKFLAEYPFIPKENIRVIYSGIKASDFTIKKKIRRSKVKTFLFVASWTEVKGVLIFLDAMQDLTNKGYSFQALIAGSVHLWRLNYSREYLLEFENTVLKKIAQNPQVTWVGEVPYTQLCDLYNRADFLICPSLWEDPAPLVCIEASLSGTQIIGFRSGGIPELVMNERNGIVVTQKTKKALVNTLEKVISEPVNQITRLKARQWIIDNFSYEKRTKIILALFSSW